MALLLFVRSVHGETAPVEVDMDGTVEDLRAEIQRVLDLNCRPSLSYQGSQLEFGALADSGLSSEAVVEVAVGMDWSRDHADYRMKDPDFFEVLDSHRVLYKKREGWSGIRGVGGVRSGVVAWEYRIEELCFTEATPKIVLGCCTDRLSTFYDGLDSEESWLVHVPSGDCQHRKWRKAFPRFCYGDVIKCEVDCVELKVRFYVNGKTCENGEFDLPPATTLYPYVMFSSPLSLSASLT
eukprot:TRINITY_DN2324_c0_g1_i2.p1 TRINITY_DN2324_c0_g1~~TRINITY_DN2324_c0_g1_i2.p1  ORF type:complete len:238 (+),score=30.67 TRINITY_DN2324_c0_g1_i2:58-771(+)